MKSGAYYIEKLELTPHVEGGAFREVYRSSGMIKVNALPKDFEGDRNFCTSIYFLLQYGQFSAFHKIASDEMWHFYDGHPLTIYEIDQHTGTLIKHQLGSNLENGETFQCVISAGNWFASRCEVPKGFSLVGCTVSPGFDFQDFILAERESLTQEYPDHAALITSLTRI